MESIIINNTYAHRLREINKVLNEENTQQTILLQNDEKYINYIKWAKDNGVIFEENIIFPVAYGPKGLVGGKANRTIGSNEALLFIPKRLMIYSSDFEEKYVIDDEYSDDKSSILLTLFLLEEKYTKNNKSFIQPYLDLLPEQDFCVFWKEADLSELDNPSLVEAIVALKYDFEDTYYKLPSELQETYSLESFTMFFSHVLSRQFYINDETSALIPFGDALNHFAVKIKYEVFDSEHFVCKYTNDFSTNKEIKPTSCHMFYNHLTNKDIEDKNDHSELIDLNCSDISMRDKDYFIISTNEQVFEEGKQVFNNYGCLSNKSFLKYYCFALLDNKYDYTLISMSFERGNYLFDKNMEVMFKKAFSTKTNAFHNILKLKVKKKEICKDILKYYRFKHFYDTQLTKMLFQYTFDYDIELSCLTKTYILIQDSLKILNDKHSIEYDIDLLEKEIPKGSYSDRLITAVIYRLTQKINLAYQKDLIDSLMVLFQKYKPKTYAELLDYVDTLSNISQYEEDKISRIRLVSFINYHV